MKKCRVASIIFIICFLISVGGSTAFTEAQARQSASVQEFLNAANDVVGISYIKDRCLQFVSDFFANGRDGYEIPGMGFQGAYNLGSAISLWNSLKEQGKTNSSMSNIPIGADVFFDNSVYGHVGIYLGNGQFLNAGEKVYVNSFRNDPSTGDFYENHYLGWAWHPNVEIYGLSSVTIDGNSIDLLGLSNNNVISIDNIDSLISIESYDKEGHITIERGENAAVASYSIHNYTMRWNEGENLLKIMFTRRGILEQYLIHVNYIPNSMHASYRIIGGPAYFNGHYYTIYAGTSTWDQANAYCESVGGHLATITDQGEQSFINRLNLDERCLWTGGYRDDNFNWHWVTGEEWNYTNWSDGEPNNSDEIIPNENRIAVYPNKWNDLNVENTYQTSGFICEIDNMNTETASTGESGDITVIASGDCGENATWTLNNHGVMTISGTGKVVAFQCDKEDVRHLTIEEGVATIGSNAFSGYTNLDSVTIPSSIEDIESYAFSGCTDLISIAIPIGTARIEIGAFSGCSGLKSVILPTGLESIGSGAFSNCMAVKQIICSPDTPTLRGSTNFGSPDGVSVIIRGEAADVGELMFLDCKRIDNVTIQEGVTGISNSAFSGCEDLKSVIIPSTVSKIGSRAFYNCDGLTTLTIPAGVNELESYAFGSCDGLASIILEEGLPEIGNYAFYGCSSLSSVTIPSSVESIGYEAFGNCSMLKAVSFSPSAPSISSSAFDGCDNISVTLRGETKAISDNAFKDCTWIENLEIENGITEIGRYAFSGCTGIKNVSIPASVRNIYWNALPPLDEISFSPDVPVLYENAIAGSENGLHVRIRGEAQDIRDEAFREITAQQAITKLTIEAGVTGIGKDSFAGCIALTEVQVEHGLSRIGDGAFMECSALTHLTIPSGVISIGQYAFNRCSSLTNITIPEGVTEIGPYAFVGCNLTSINLPSTLISLGTGVFNNSGSILAITLPDNLQTYGSGAIPDPIVRYATIGTSASRAISIENESFCDANYPGLFFKYVYEEGDIADFAIVDANETIASITWPEDITMISDYAFSCCSELSSIIVPESVSSIGSGAFDRCTKLQSLVLPSSIKQIESSTFISCENLSEMFIPDSVTSIGQSAFSGCSSLRTVHLPANLIEIPNNLFSGCSSLTEIDIPTGVTSIGSRAFLRSGLTSVIIPENVISIGENAFQHCESLLSIILPNKLSSIGDYAFEYCISLETVSTHGSESEYLSTANGTGMRSFYKCTSLKHITIPKGIKVIGNYTFDSCTSLVNITIPDNVDTISGYAFIYCDQLESVTIPNYINIEANAFSGGSTPFLKKLATLEQDRVKSGSYIIENNAFSRTLLTDLMLPWGSQIEGGAFQSVAEETITIVVPDGCESFSLSFQTNQSVHVYLPKELNNITASVGEPENTTIHCYWNTPSSSWARGKGYQIIYLDEQEEAFNPTNYITPVSLEEYNERIIQGDPKVHINNQPNGFTTIYDQLDGRNSIYDAEGILLNFSFTAQIDDISYSAMYNQNGYLAGISSLETLSNGGNLQKQYNVDRILIFETIYFNSLRINYSHNTNNEEYKKAISGVEYIILPAEFFAVKNGGQPNADVPGIIRLPSALTAIESEAFIGLPQGTLIVIPDTVVSIAQDAFDANVILVCGSNSQAYAICKQMGWTVVTDASGL